MPIYEEFFYDLKGVSKRSKKTLSGLELWNMYRDDPYSYIKFTQVKYGDSVLYSVSH